MLALFFFVQARSRGYKHLPKIGLFVPGRLRNIVCLAGSEDRTEGTLFRVGFGSISKGVIERRSWADRSVSALFR